MVGNLVPLVGNPSVTPSVTTTYTVTGTDGNGCTGTATTSVDGYFYTCTKSCNSYSFNHLFGRSYLI
jgi:hypothetical protein